MVLAVRNSLKIYPSNSIVDFSLSYLCNFILMYTSNFQYNSIAIKFLLISYSITQCQSEKYMLKIFWHDKINAWEAYLYVICIVPQSGWPGRDLRSVVTFILPGGWLPSFSPCNVLQLGHSRNWGKLLAISLTHARWNWCLHKLRLTTPSLCTPVRMKIFKNLHLPD